MLKSDFKHYQSPTTSIYSINTKEFCIGFGEGSIPPEESDSNLGWFDEESYEEYHLPNITSKLWNE